MEIIRVAAALLTLDDQRNGNGVLGRSMVAAVEMEIGRFVK